MARGILLAVTLLVGAADADHDDSARLSPRVACGVTAYQFINYAEIYGTGGTLCYRVERA